MYKVYTDGGCKSAGLGAWAFAIVKDDTLLEAHSGIVDKSTNNRMELTAIIEALKKFDPSSAVVEVLSDSAYCVNCFKQQWYVKWQRNGWVNSSKEPVLNKDLWEELLQKVESFKTPIVWTHVKGHSGNKWNEHVDGLCRKEFNASGIGGIVPV